MWPLSHVLYKNAQHRTKNKCLVLMFHICCCWSLDVTWWYSIKSLCLKNMCFVVSSYFFFWLGRKCFFMAIPKPRSLLEPLFSHYFVTLKFFSQALLCVPALLAALCWNKNIIIPRCEKVIKKSLAAASEAAENLLSFIKNPGNSWDIFLLPLDLLLSRLHTVAKLQFW